MAKTHKEGGGNLQGWPGDCENPDTDGEKDAFKRSGDWVEVDGKVTKFPLSDNPPKK